MRHESLILKSLTVIGTEIRFIKHKTKVKNTEMKKENIRRLSKTQEGG